MPNHLPDDDAINQAIVEHQLNISGTLLRCLLCQLAAALPIARDTPDSIAAETQQAARELFFAMQPQSAEEAAAAVRAVTAHFAAMDLYARAARPGMSDDTVMRLRTACDRAAAAGQSRRGKTQQPSTPAHEIPAAPLLPEPPLRPQMFQPRDPDLEVTAMVDEQAMIAGKQALEAAARRTNGDARQS